MKSLRSGQFRTPYLPLLVIFLIFMAIRLHQLMSFPPFLDEIDHIAWSRDVYTFHPFTGAINGKLFGLWWLAPFGLYGDGVLWLARAVTLLFGLIGVAALYRLGRDLVSVEAGLWAALLYVISPFMFFYERLALMDSYTMTWGILLAWASVKWAKAPRARYAILCGIILIMPLLAKATGLMLVVVPILALLFLPPRITKAHLKTAAIVYGIFAGFWGPFYLFLRWRGYSYFGTATNVVGTSETGNLVSRLLSNIGETIQIDVIYFTVPVVIGGIALALFLLIRHTRIAAFILSLTLIPLGGLLLFATKMSARYIMLHVPFLILWLAVGLTLLARMVKQKWLVPVIVGAWTLLFVIPFLSQYWRDPAQLVLTPLERLEYITSDASGYGLEDAAQVLKTQSSIPGQSVLVYGLLPTCGGLDYFLPNSDFTLICPPLSSDPTRQALTAADIDRHALTQPVWIVFEEVPFVSLTALTTPLEQIQTLSRPDDRTQIIVYRVSASDQR